MPDGINEYDGQNVVVVGVNGSLNGTSLRTASTERRQNEASQVSAKSSGCNNHTKTSLDAFKIINTAPKASRIFFGLKYLYVESMYHVVSHYIIRGASEYVARGVAIVESSSTLRVCDETNVVEFEVTSPREITT